MRHRGHLNLGRLLLAGALVAVLGWGAGSAKAIACDTSWTGSTDSDWFNAGNWTSNVPGSGTDACIPDGSFTVVIDGATEASASAAAANTLLVGAGDVLKIK